MIRTHIAVAAVALSLTSLLGCGGDDDSESQSYSLDPVAECLRDGGATGVSTRNAGEVPGEVAAHGAVQGTAQGVRFALAFEPDEATATTTAETLHSQISGDSEQRKILANGMVKRSANVAIAYERPPNVAQSEIVAECLGGESAIQDVAPQ